MGKEGMGLGMADGNASMDCALLIISVCKDNPEDLLATCQSVAHQVVPPLRHLVVDSSGPTFKGQMQNISRSCGSDYLWVEPQGIYQAMLQGLEQAQPNEWVWFVNATDWLSTSNSVRHVFESVASTADETNPVWWVGQTVVGADIPHLMKFSPTGDDFVRQLRRGSLGLPHSSTVVQAGALREVDAFDGHYRISRDYEMGLRLSEVFGAPGVIPYPLSIYDESGESARNAWRNVLHKSEARIKTQPLWQLPAEPFRILAAGRRELLRRRLRKNPDNERLWRALGWERVDPEMAKPFWN